MQRLDHCHTMNIIASTSTDRLTVGVERLALLLALPKQQPDRNDNSFFLFFSSCSGALASASVANVASAIFRNSPVAFYRFVLCLKTFIGTHAGDKSDKLNLQIFETLNESFRMSLQERDQACQRQAPRSKRLIEWRMEPFRIIQKIIQKFQNIWNDIWNFLNKF